MSELLNIGEVSVHPQSGLATWAAGTVQLSPKERDLFAALCRSGDTPLAKAQILAQVWPDQAAGNRNRVMAAIHRLKQKVAQGPDAPLDMVNRNGAYQLRPRGGEVKREGLPLTRGQLDLGRGQLHTDEGVIALSGKEREVLAILAASPNQYLPRMDIVVRIWGPGNPGKVAALSTLLYRVRTKIEVDPKQPQHVLGHSNQGVGLFWTVEEAMVEEQVEAVAEAPFVGRVEVLLHLVDTLKAGARCLTLLGPGGFGKTRTVRRLLQRAEVCDVFEWGAVFCDLMDCRTEEDLLERVAHCLGLRLAAHPSFEERVAYLGKALALRPRNLIVLDNFEQLVSFAASTLGVWVRLAGAVQFVVTSRRRLGLATEQVLPLEPLPPQDSLTLFLDRAKRVGPEHRFGVRERTRLAPLVAKLEGNALAILLSAGQLQHQPFEAWAEEQEKNNNEGGLLNEVLQRSWDLLPPPERAVLVQATLFRGGFSLECAEEVLWTDDRWMDEVVESLLDHSLLYCRMDTGVARYELYESVREFAVGKRSTLADPKGLEERFVAFFVELSDHWRFHVQKHGDDAQSKQIAAENANLWTALECAKREEAPGRDALLLLLQEISRHGRQHARILAESEQLNDFSSPKHKGMVRINQVEIYRHFGRVEEANALLADIIQDPTIPQNIRLYTEYGLVMSAMNKTGDRGPAELFLQKHLEVLPPRGAERAFLLNGLARIRIDQGRFLEGIQRYSDAVQAGRGIASDAFIHSVEGNIGHAKARMGSLEEALDILKEKLEQMQSARQIRFDKVMTCWTLGRIHLLRGRFTEAVSCFQIGQDAALTVGHPEFVRLMSAVKASALTLLGEAGAAADCFRAHPPLERAQSSYDEVASGLYALHLLHLGETELAAHRWRLSRRECTANQPIAASLDRLWEAHYQLATSPDSPQAISHAETVSRSSGVMVPRAPISDAAAGEFIPPDYWAHVVWLEEMAKQKSGLPPSNSGH